MDHEHELLALLEARLEALACQDALQRLPYHTAFCVVAEAYGAAEALRASTLAVQTAAVSLAKQRLLDDAWTLLKLVKR